MMTLLQNSNFVDFHMWWLGSCDMMSEDADVTPHCNTKPVIIGQRVSVILSGDSSLALSIT